MLNMSKDFEIVKADTNTTAGTTDTITSDAVEVAGAQSVLCIVDLGTITANGTATLQVTECDTSNGSYTDITGATAAAADDDDDTYLAVEVVKPKQRYIKIDCDRATANVVLGGMYAIVSKRKQAPITQGATAAAAPAVVLG